MAHHLPVADPATISDCQKEYIRLRSEDSREAPAACFRFIWALAHSENPAHNQRALDLAQQMIQAKQLDDQGQKDLMYLLALAQYKTGNMFDARAQINSLLEVAPNSRQARQLKSIIEDQMVKEGLIAAGVGAALVAGAGLLLGALLSKRR